MNVLGLILSIVLFAALGFVVVWFLRKKLKMSALLSLLLLALAAAAAFYLLIWRNAEAPGATNAMFIVAAFAVFAAGLTFMAWLGTQEKIGFALWILIALAVGAVYGVVFKLFNSPTNVTATVYGWIQLLGDMFIAALKLLVVPLVLVSVINAIGKIEGGKEAGRKTGGIIAILLITCAISGVIGYLSVIFFDATIGLDVGNLVRNASASAAEATAVTDMIKNIVPSNLFVALSGTNALPVVFIAMLLGFAMLAIRGSEPETAKSFESAIGVAHEFIMQIVDYIIGMTPYGVFAIIAARVIDADVTVLLSLLKFVLAAYVAMIVIYGIHMLMLLMVGQNPAKFIKKSGPALINGFATRSSSATLPITIKCMEDMGVSEATASLSGSFGTCIGQNGCAGVHPSMVATMVAMVSGVDIFSMGFIIPMIIYVVISSIGIAGVGGGAMAASLLVLSLMNLDVALVAVLASVEFIIDMGRTALNINDSMLAGVMVDRPKQGVREKAKAAE